MDARSQKFKGLSELLRDSEQRCQGHLVKMMCWMLVSLPNSKETEKKGQICPQVKYDPFIFGC